MLLWSNACFEQFVPVPTEEFVCTQGCCTRMFCPLTVAYARTIHKFQGLSAGPVDAGKIKNMHDVLICDPDERMFEGTALGLLYTAVSRATTLGDDDGRDSAIYFFGSAMTKDRVRHLTFKVDNKTEFELAKKRRHWVNYLMARAVESRPFISAATAKADYLFQWSRSNTYDYDTLYKRIRDYTVSHDDYNQHA